MMGKSTQKIVNRKIKTEGKDKIITWSEERKDGRQVDEEAKMKVMVCLEGAGDRCVEGPGGATGRGDAQVRQVTHE